MPRTISWAGLDQSCKAVYLLSSSCVWPFFYCETAIQSTQRKRPGMWVLLLEPSAFPLLAVKRLCCQWPIIMRPTLKNIHKYCIGVRCTIFSQLVHYTFSSSTP